MFPLDFTGINTFLSPIISKVFSESFQLLSFVVLLSLLILAILFVQLWVSFYCLSCHIYSSFFGISHRYVHPPTTNNRLQPAMGAQ